MACGQPTGATSPDTPSSTQAAAPLGTSVIAGTTPAPIASSIARQVPSLSLSSTLASMRGRNPETHASDCQPWKQTSTQPNRSAASA